MPPTPLPRTAPQPFEVDVVADVWAIISSLSTLGAAIGTVLAFWLAAFTYRRQVNIERRVHASKVTVFVGDDGAISVENLGELPAYAVRLYAALSNEPSAVVSNIRRLAQGKPETVFKAPAIVNAEGFKAWATFTDPNGLKWTRHLNGDLKYEGKSE